MTITELCAAMNAPDIEFSGIAAWDRAAYSRKIRGVTALWPAEIGKLAKVLGMPHGFPWIEEKDALLLESGRRQSAGSRNSRRSRG